MDGEAIFIDLSAVLMTNQMLHSIFGYEEGELLGQAVEVLVHDEIAGSHVEMQSGYVKNPVIRSMGETRDVEIKKKDDTLCMVEVGLSSVYVKDGLLVFTSVVDLALRKEYEAAVQKESHEL